MYIYIAYRAVPRIRKPKPAAPEQEIFAPEAACDSDALGASPVAYLGSDLPGDLENLVGDVLWLL